MEEVKGLLLIQFLRPLVNHQIAFLLISWSFVDDSGKFGYDSYPDSYQNQVNRPSLTFSNMGKEMLEGVLQVEDRVFVCFTIDFIGKY